MTAVEDTARQKKREGRRRGGPSEARIQQKPFQQPRLTLDPIKFLSEDNIEAIHDASMRLLEEVGMEVILNKEALEIYRRAGAKVDGERVRIGREIVDEALRRAPSEFVLNARNPAHSVRFGGNWIVFGPVGGPPNCSDMDRGRRPGSFEDSCNFIRLSQFFNIIHMSGGGSTDALDIHASVRHLHVGRAKARLSDKVYFVSSTGRERLFDGLEIARIACGVPKDKIDDTPVVMTVINTNSPMKLDGPMAMGIIELARHGQVCCVTPFTLAGAMAPVTMAGALVEQNAEALAGLVLSQFTRAGAKFIYGGFTSNVDMKSGAPAFGTPEYMKAAIAGGQLARRYKLPYRTSSTNAANTVDAQAAYESVFSLWGAIMGGGNLIVHAAGWMEGGLVGSFEKFALDVDLCQMVAEFLTPLDMSEDALGVAAVKEVGPGGHFFGAQQTLERYSNAFYAPLISDWRNFQSWQAAGSPEAQHKANALWKQALAEYEEPPIDPAIAEEVDDYVERRIREGGQPTDF